MAKVRNINGTSSNTCTCGSWLAHWQKFAGYNKALCSVNGCSNRDLVGAHVQKAYSSDLRWYIVPLCRAHNNSSGVLDVGSTSLVSANKSLTCEG